MIAACSATTPQDSATIAVATNFKTTLEKLQSDFETRSGYSLNIVSGSTGKLYAQIVNGAPYDVFLAADQARPERLVENGQADRASRFTYARGRLALWTPNERIAEAVTFHAPPPARFAIANPELAPYGRAAIDVIESLEIKSELQDRLVFGENVGQAFAFTKTGNTTFGVVAYAQILSLPEHQQGSFFLPSQDLYEPIDQDLVLLNRGRDNQAAIAFLTYLKSDDARYIIVQNGFERL